MAISIYTIFKHENARSALADYVVFWDADNGHLFRSERSVGRGKLESFPLIHWDSKKLKTSQKLIIL